MSISQSDLRTRHAELTHSLILDAAIELLTEDFAAELSVRGIAERAGMSERTVFRYFASRDDLFDAVATEMRVRVARPPIPDRLDALPDFPAVLFARFEAVSPIARASLRSDFYVQTRERDFSQFQAQTRKLVDDAVPTVDPELRRLASLNLLYHSLGATWQFYRFRFGLSAEDAVAAARLAISTTIAELYRAAREG